MKALIFGETGEPSGVLKLADIPTPPLAPGEALVRVLLSPINPSDLHMVRGRYGYQPELPASPGAEGVGVVEAVGPGGQSSIVGTRVVFVDTWNTWREQVVCPMDKLVPIPNGLDDSVAATSYTNPLTAWALTRSSHNLQEGEWLLQTAAASSVGKLVLQLAQQYRFKTVNVIRRREQETIIRKLGGNEVICTADEDLRARLTELTSGKGVERAIDCVAGELGAEIARNLAPGGRYRSNQSQHGIGRRSLRSCTGSREIYSSRSAWHDGRLRLCSVLRRHVDGPPTWRLRRLQRVFRERRWRPAGSRVRLRRTRHDPADVRTFILEAPSGQKQPKAGMASIQMIRTFAVTRKVHNRSCAGFDIRWPQVLTGISRGRMVRWIGSS